LESIVQRIAPHAFVFASSVRLHRVRDRLLWSALRGLAGAERAVANQSNRVERAAPGLLIRRAEQRLQDLADLLPTVVKHRLTLSVQQMRGQQERLAAMSYKSVLGRGFSITRLKQGRDVVRSLRQLRDRMRVLTEVSDGQFESEVVNLQQLELFEPE
jgi:exonuclease VII large subunit